ncbi:2-C-methyl-D-erythritol 4-phosphate cytidylyltransferase [Aureibacter tunicatorum]|uniref:2-C-methyl-D-erythritol 4-phosphate cytidylyltransferase n=1 Tax=Aureibacter tunicatorum TaxID=866807 RepID=A0AAE4BSW3_9BACT|nr:2-C-methyl-D-erythritol 4-phosphate cytidylyltransferase [Aureibacter tunicatorum]MDR6240191.1 2-C-methyl-D-erythritol 4-phosphate cytidylyltransferase [Aureibacter tunicatorum]BDD05928.1 2-C-methyl-D-erythritol 4-phosphate cytidylyltransferase [Aureibacter tunicatorum]
MKYNAIIVAGGSGTRMQSSIPKQFLRINNTPIIIHTIRAFQKFSKEINIILVLPKDSIPIWEELKKQYTDIKDIQTCLGGKSRFQSVSNGLACIKSENNNLVAIHDGVRPFATVQMIQNAFDEAEKYGNAICSVKPKDSIRKLNAEGNSQAVDREAYRIIQTPQTFKVEVIKQAFQTEEMSFFTDDASVAEYAGHMIHLVEGSYENIKITTPEDLYLGEAILSKQK